MRAMMRPTLLILALLGGPALAQTAPGSSLPAEPEPIRGEPKVQLSVIEDGGSKVEELRVRGNTTRISVTPKVGGALPYEILTEDGSRDVSDGLSGSRGAAGKRVWRVLSF
jgi:hypothetical protein